MSFLRQVSEVQLESVEAYISYSSYVCGEGNPGGFQTSEFRVRSMYVMISMYVYIYIVCML